MYPNAYFRAPAGYAAGGGFIPTPGGYFGAQRGAMFGQRGNAVYSYPVPDSYFGRGGNGACSPCPPPPCPDPARMQELWQHMRHPLGRWPLMPPLDCDSQQLAAAATVAGAQVHADRKQLVYGIDSEVVVPANATALITVQPQKRHVPEKLVMSESMAADFIITQIDVGVEPVLATTGPISAAIFVQDSTTSAFKAVICEVGTQVTVGVTNISAADRRFITTMVGLPIPPGY